MTLRPAGVSGGASFAPPPRSPPTGANLVVVSEMWDHGRAQTVALVISERGQRYAEVVLAQLSWWAATEAVDARIIDRAVARFLVELDVPCCPRCGDELYAKGYCRRCYRSVFRKQR